MTARSDTREFVPSQWTEFSVRELRSGPTRSISAKAGSVKLQLTIPGDDEREARSSTPIVFRGTPLRILAGAARAALDRPAGSQRRARHAGQWALLVADRVLRLARQSPTGEPLDGLVTVAEAELVSLELACAFALAS